MIDIIKHRLYFILWCTDLQATRFTLAMSALLWAACLFWPGPLFTDARTTYHIMRNIAPEIIWAILFLIQGLSMLWSLIMIKRPRVILWIDGILGCILWSTSTIACFAAHWPLELPFLEAIKLYAPPAAMSGELMLMLASFWVLVRFHVDPVKE